MGWKKNLLYSYPFLLFSIATLRDPLHLRSSYFPVFCSRQTCKQNMYCYMPEFLSLHKQKGDVEVMEHALLMKIRFAGRFCDWICLYFFVTFLLSCIYLYSSFFISCLPSFSFLRFPFICNLVSVILV